MINAILIRATSQRMTGLVATAVLFCVSLLLTIAIPAVAEAKPFGIERFSVQTTVPREVPEPLEEGGFRIVNEPYTFTQAGGHPIGLTTTFVFDSEEFEYGPGNKNHSVSPTEDPKDVVVDVPAGLIGDPLAVPRCALTNVTSKKLPCPADTQVGLVRIRTANGEKENVGPIYDVTPEAGQSAEFALVVKEVDIVATAHLVRTEQGYGITVVSNGIASVELIEAEATFWGVPAEERYNRMRGLSCAKPSDGFAQCVLPPGSKGVKAGVAPVAFLTMPTDCSAGPEVATIRADSWEDPGHAEGSHYEKYVEGPPWTMPAVTGCNLLKFEPGIRVEPGTLLADMPVGLGVNVEVPQSEQPGTLGTPHLRQATVTLPLGMSISPGIVDGIQACNAEGPEGIDFEAEEIGVNGELQLAPGHCPDASTVGEAEAETPLLPSPVKGHVYLARPGCGAAGEAACTEQDALDGNLYKLYLELGGTGALGDAGVNVKVEGRVEANPATGQLTAVFDQNPQLPFSELRLKMNGGPRAPLANPAVCGMAQTIADFMPWSAPGETPQGLFVAGTPDATPFSSFGVQGCVGATPGLNPEFVAGTVTPQAGRYSAFTMNLSRGDREEYVKGIQLHTPPGLLGTLASVPLCAEPAADQGTCPEASKIGTTRVATGAGSHPFEIEGNVYLTGPYGGDPFGLSIVVHVTAGPFNLGVRVVRARIAVDPENSTLTVTTDETGPYMIPQIVFGVPVRLKRITVDIDRPNFMFNPTNCDAQHIVAKISGSQEMVVSVSSPFAASDCKGLAFKPMFTVSAAGKTSRPNGASLDAKLSYPKGALGEDANIARVKVDLPKQLPSRLSTLQKACVAAVFDANPAACPKASIVGIVRASTPLLPVSLAGPVYFVSHGGEAFPSLIVVLQGDGVRVDLTGTTFINEKTNVTSSTFKTVPDVPVNSFELYLPEGKYSALAALGNLCKLAGRLKMPTEFVAQNGAVVKQSTKIAITGCAVKKKTAKKKTTPTRRRTAVSIRGLKG